MRVREPVVADAAAMAEVHVAAWRAAYRGGLMPDDLLDGLSVAQRTGMWRQVLRAPVPPPAVRLVAEHGGRVVGFVVAGASDEPGEDRAAGEVHALNVSPDHWGAGHGRALLAGATDGLARMGVAEAILWVHVGNQRARRFYERAGWAADGASRTAEVLDAVVPEVRYRRVL